MNYPIATHLTPIIPGAVHQPPSRYGSPRNLPPHEESLLDWWRLEAPRAPRRLTDGRVLIIEDPGLLNDGPGPDFRHASLWLDDWRVVGDVECHLRAADWWRHGHDRDPAYTGVVLHVVQEAAGGPSLPTVVAPSTLSTAVCVARRAPTAAELVRYAAHRFEAKQARLARLKAQAPHCWGRLGLCEVMAYGPHRRAWLHALATQLGWEAWPSEAPWRGSRQTRRSGRYPEGAFRWAWRQTFLDTEPIQASPPFRSLHARLQRALQAAGYPLPWATEWIINIVIPSLAPTVAEGLAWWSSWEPPRPYGAVARLANRIGIKVATVWEQQALLGWYQALCRGHHCSQCPLARLQTA